MITKLKRNQKFDVPYLDTYYFEFDRLDDMVGLLYSLSEWTGVDVVRCCIKSNRFTGSFVVDNYVVPEDFYEQLTQKTFNYED